MKEDQHVRTRTRRWLAAAVLVAAATTACNGGSDPTADTTSTASPATTEPTTAPPPTISDVGRRLLEDPDAVIFAAGIESQPENREVLRDYVRSEQAWIRAGMAPVDPEHPDLLATTTGAVLANRQAALRTMRDDNEAYQAPKQLRVTPTRIQIAGATAEILACFTQRVPVYSVATGAVADDDLFSVQNRASMERSGGRWVLASIGGVGEARDGESCGD